MQSMFSEHFETRRTIWLINGSFAEDCGFGWHGLWCSVGQFGRMGMAVMWMWSWLWERKVDLCFRRDSIETNREQDVLRYPKFGAASMSKRELVIIFRIGEPCHLNSAWEIPKVNLTNAQKPKRSLWTSGIVITCVKRLENKQPVYRRPQGTCLIAGVTHFGMEDLSFLNMMHRWCGLHG
ncbi:uncharacterized protein LOC121266541 [Juglans microcarpa x Juglans regia]|uniref:uncharacterized protein LOC121266541 n=1 Tax=Juglans microcarpa x Juglans regia TaxID=2249226 RepID=UPI001B7E1A95|nr:uncharacterized protein LOC121266541 [Juglans microcarpa x Juglans regia]XP_041026331.1 uncharacterized protein LOC121266541 [Juglans microcarpa x Juglans regia]XP_041026332.1 uncharacterized protein LOC121266541 [Juglans microcarpa x Juglans regia]